MKRLIPLIILLTLVFQFCSSPGQKEKESEVSNVTVAHWGHSKILIYLPLYVAMDGGFFEDEGLNVQLKYSGNDDQVFATVLSGEAQFGVGDPAFTVIAREKGGQGKIVAALVNGLANWGVTRKGESNMIQNYSELEGRRISSFPSPSTTYTLLKDIIATNELKEVQVVEATFGTELALLESNEVDLAIMLEPNTSIAVARGHEVTFDLAGMFGPFLLTGVTAKDDFIERNPQQVEKFRRGLQNALDFCASNSDSAASIVAKSFPDLERSVVDLSLNRMVQSGVIPLSIDIDKDAFDKLINIRKSVGDISLETDASAAVHRFNAN